MKKVIILLIAITASFGSFAQKVKAKSDTGKVGTIIYTYACSMHPDVTSDKPGKCSKCGMDLGLSKKEILKREVVNLYSCPMHPEITSDKSGKCSSCGMDLALSKKEILKRKEVGLYTCPMHPDVVSEKSGKCPKCGMDMAEKKPTAKSKS